MSLLWFLVLVAIAFAAYLSFLLGRWVGRRTK